MRSRMALVLTAAAVALSACTGVPASSAPEVIRSVGVSSPVFPTITPSPGADPRQIVNEFLGTNVSQDATHAAARAFLTPQERNRWNDNTLTVVDTMQIGNFDATNSTVTVLAQPVGSVNAAGLYAPVLQGTGQQLTYVFTMKQIAGQWRIDNLSYPGLLLAESDFADSYSARELEFYNLTGTQLVPDPRYTALSAIVEPSVLATWLIQQLVAGPRPELLNSVAPLGALAQTDPRRVTATVDGESVSVEIPGSSQLDGSTLNHLAAQVSATLSQALAQPPSGSLSFTLTDGGKPVRVPAAHASTFTMAAFPALTPRATPIPPVYYIGRRGNVIEVNNGQSAPLPGLLGSGRYLLASVAMAAHGSTDAYAAGVVGVNPRARLWVGTQSGGLNPTSVEGRLTRPAWAPGLDEVWIGRGAQIVRVNAKGTASVVGVTPASGVISGRVRALRLSPDGARIAVVYSGPAGTAQLWIGSVVRGATGAVRIDSMEPITPSGIAVVDVAWYGPVKLFVAGSPVGTSTPGIFEVEVDGSQWIPSFTTNLPGAPDSITITDNAFAWVSVGGTLWEQTAGEWISPTSPADTYGTNPAYLD